MQAVLCGYYGFANGGDEALLASLLQMLPSSVEPVILTKDPLTAHYGFACCDRWNLFAVSQAIARADAFIWGGGSLLQDVTGPSSLLYYGGLMALAQTLGKRTIAWAQGIGPLKSAWSRTLTQRILQNCTAISVRDQGSAQMLSDWGIPFELTCDPVWGLQASSYVLDAPTPRIAVILRNHPDLTSERLATFIEALQQFQLATGGYILCVPFQNTDVQLAQQISDRLRGSSQVVVIEDPQKLMGLFETVQFTIAMRLHGALMAAASGSKVWGLIYDPKVAYLLQQIDAPGCELRDLPNQPAALCQKWLDHYTQGVALSDIQRSSWAERAALNSEILKQVLTAK
jgi:polysaccharide pyruvyl transferase CsaB